MNVDPENLVVTDITPDAQAQRAGVALHSHIVAVDGVATESYEGFLAQRQARIDAGAGTFALRFVLANKDEDEDPYVSAPLDESEQVGTFGIEDGIEISVVRDVTTVDVVALPSETEPTSAELVAEPAGLLPVK